MRVCTSAYYAFLAFLSIGAIVGMVGCDQAPPPKEIPPPAPIKTRSDLDVNIREDGSSDFNFRMHSNARSPKEATEKAIRALEQTIDAPATPEKPFAAIVEDKDKK